MSQKLIVELEHDISKKEELKDKYFKLNRMSLARTYDQAIDGFSDECDVHFSDHHDKLIHFLQTSRCKNFLYALAQKSCQDGAFLIDICEGIKAAKQDPTMTAENCFSQSFLKYKDSQSFAKGAEEDEFRNGCETYVNAKTGNCDHIFATYKMACVALKIVHDSPNVNCDTLKIDDYYHFGDKDKAHAAKPADMLEGELHGYCTGALTADKNSIVYSVSAFLG